MRKHTPLRGEKGHGSPEPALPRPAADYGGICALCLRA